VLLELLPRLGREVWLADPGRPPLGDFLARIEHAWEVRATEDPVTPAVRVFRLRARA
jgi:hypothetical protein